MLDPSRIRAHSLGSACIENCGIRRIKRPVPRNIENFPAPWGEGGEPGEGLAGTIRLKGPRQPLRRNIVAISFALHNQLTTGR
jgi:hypothetical protein